MSYFKYKSVNLYQCKIVLSLKQLTGSSER